MLRWSITSSSARSQNRKSAQKCRIAESWSIFLWPFYEDCPHPVEDADPDIPILKEAKAEYAKLQ